MEPEITNRVISSSHILLIETGLKFSPNAKDVT